MAQNSYNPPGFHQPWAPPPQLQQPALSTIESAESYGSFVSQAPMPYHMAYDQTHNSNVASASTNSSSFVSPPIPPYQQSHFIAPQPGYRNPNGHQQYQPNMNAYSAQTHGEPRPGYNANPPMGAFLYPQYQQPFGPYQSSDDGKKLARRSTHNQRHGRDNWGNGKYGASKRFVSAGNFRGNGQKENAPALKHESRSTTPSNTHSTRSNSPMKPIGHGRHASTKHSVGHIAMKPEEQTPASKVVTTRKTPKTARGLGEYTPTPILRSRRGESVSTAMKSLSLSKELPPPFYPQSDGVSPNPVLKLHNAPGSTLPQPDPFVSYATANSLAPPGTQHGSTPSRALTPLVVHHALPYSGPSPHLLSLAPQGIKPSLEVAFADHNMPFVELARTHQTIHTTGVVKITNIPYSCTRQEILAFLGRNAKIISEIDEPIHIIMERVTSKTMDAFVEFISIDEAALAISRYESNRAGGRGSRLGERHVDLEVVGHDHLMHAIFPKAANVQWKGTIPEVSSSNDKYNSGFKGFVMQEELVMLVKHVECPQRSPFSRECPQRPYECLITTLLKYPWQMVNYITIAERDALFDAAVALCKFLVQSVTEYPSRVSVDQRLLRRVRHAVLKCDGFTESQKDDFAYIFQMTSIQAGLAPHADQWFVFKTLSAKPGWTPDVVLYYIAVLREATISSEHVSLAEKSAQAATAGGCISIFGNINITYPQDVASRTLAEVAEIEWTRVEELLRRVLPE